MPAPTIAIRSSNRHSYERRIAVAREVVGDLGILGRIDQPQTRRETATVRGPDQRRARAGSARSSRWSRSSCRRSGSSRRWACCGASPSTGSTSPCSPASTSSARSARRSASTATSRTRASRRARPVKAALAVLGCMTMQGPLTQWVTDHRKHHALSDKQGDPHSPHVGHGDGVVGRGPRVRPRPRRLALHDLRAWSRGASTAATSTRTGSSGRSTASTCSGSCSRSGSRSRSATRSAARWQAGLEALVWGGLIRIFLYQHATFSVNSICHMFGRKDYRSRDEARNNWLVALLVFGEGWHNNHHAFPASARHGLRPVPDRRLVVGDPRRWRSSGSCWNVQRARLRGSSSESRLQPSPRLEPPTRRAGPAAAPAGAGPAVPKAADGDAVQRARDERVVPIDAARLRPLEARARARGLTPGMPGRQRSSAPWKTTRRRPSSGREASRSGIQGARPSTLLDGRVVRGLDRDRPAHREPEQQRSRAHLLRDRPRARPRRRCRAGCHDLMRYLTSTNARCGKPGASRCTSHSSEALQVPGTAPAWPPFTQTTTSRPVSPVTRISAPVERATTTVTRGAQGRARAGPAARRGRRRPSA